VFCLQNENDAIRYSFTHCRAKCDIDTDTFAFVMHPPMVPSTFLNMRMKNAFDIAPFTTVLHERPAN
jgi:hypothetical protein